MKKLTALAALLLVPALFAGCTGLTDYGLPNSGGPDIAEEIDLELWTFPVGSWSNPTVVSNLLAGFHKEYPNIHVSVEYLDYATGDAQVSEAVAAGAAPDLVFEGPERLVASWGAQGWMVDLSDLWDTGPAEAIYPIAREACRDKNGTYYVYPICMSPHCMVINHDMFREAGALQYINEEAHTWTTEGFIEAVHALRAWGQETAGMVYCGNQTGDQGTRALVTNLYGGSFTDEAHSGYTVDSEEVVRALQLLSSLEGIVFEPEMGSAKAIELFCQKQSAMCFCWNASLEVQQIINNPDFDFEAYPIAFPTNRPEPVLEGGIWGLGIFHGDGEERIEAAKTFIRYLTENDAVYTKAVLASSYWPVRAMEHDIYENDILMTEYSIFMPYMEDYHQITPGWADARTAWWQLLARVGAGEDASEAVKNFPSVK